MKKFDKIMLFVLLSFTTLLIICAYVLIVKDKLLEALIWISAAGCFSSMFIIAKKSEV